MARQLRHRGSRSRLNTCAKELVVPDNLSPQLINSIVHGYNSDPFSVLGPHTVTKDGQPALAIRAFLPWATALQVVRNDGTVYDMARIHPDGFFEAVIPAGGTFGYTLRATNPAGQVVDLVDPYSLGP